MRFEHYTGLDVASALSQTHTSGVFTVAILILCDISYSFNDAALCLLCWIADLLLHAESSLLLPFLPAGQLTWCCYTTNHLLWTVELFS